MSTEAFTSSSVAVAAPAATLTMKPAGFSKFSRIGGWEVICTAEGVTISQASSFGGTQAAPVFPVTREFARQLALTLLDVVN